MKGGKKAPAKKAAGKKAPPKAAAKGKSKPLPFPAALPARGGPMNKFS